MSLSPVFTENGPCIYIHTHSRTSMARKNRDIFLIFFEMKIFGVFSLELPHRGDCIEHIQYTVFNINKEDHP